MKKANFKNFLWKIVDALFPKKSGFDFSKMEPEELFKNLPKCTDMRGATALTGKRVAAALSYKNKTTRAMVWKIKFTKDRHAVRCGAYIIYATLFHTSVPTNKPMIIIPMPASPGRRRERGYNQCELLAERIIEWTKCNENMIHTKVTFEMRTDILVRIKNIEKQTFKNRRERMENMRGAFAVVPEKGGPTEDRKEVRERTVIILDDVITTGSTLREAMDCLESAGFKNVLGFGLAH